VIFTVAKQKHSVAADAPAAKFARRRICRSILELLFG